ncbi:MAG: ketoacyl-ACP synthase III [Candidatus Omnitrophica bacterium]|nr:ketoacyl-ACP synthase III [Candidatus Omnitrophota bacterium]
MKKRAGIAGLGLYIPEKILTNYDLEKMVDTTDEWIQSRTGIKERHIAKKGESTSDLAAAAGLEALKDAGLKSSDLDLIIVATISGDMLFPSTACLVQKKIGATCPSFDLGAACSGFPYAMSVAQGLILSGLYKNILVIGAEVLSGFVDWTDRSTCVLFGDGAGAAVISEARDGHGILSTYLAADGNYADLLKVPAGGSAIPPTLETIQQKLHTLKMNGSEVFKLAVRSMGDAVLKAIQLAGIKLEQVDILIPHQANLRIIQAVAERVNIPIEKIFINLDKYGNMSSASTIVALYEAVKTGRVKPGSHIAMVAFGSGLTWASTVMKW